MNLIFGRARLALAKSRWLISQERWKSLYLFSFDSLNKSLRKRYGGKVVCTLRNSILTDAFEPPVSDLDVTLTLSNSEISAGEVRSVIKAQRFLWPMIKEINIYRKRQMKLIAEIANPFELSRDPLFEGLIDPSRKDRASAVVYLIRHLLSSLNHLILWPREQRKKWELHARRIELHSPLKERDFNEESILETLLQKLEVLCAGSLGKRILRPPKNLDPSEPWIYCLRFPELCFAPPPVGLTPFQKRIIEDQIAWEYAGLISQQGQPGELKTATHLNRLRQSAIDLGFFDRLFAVHKEAAQSLIIDHLAK